MMHILVKGVQAWQDQIKASGVNAKYGVKVTEMEIQSRRMKDFCLFDSSGVLWRVG